MELKKILNSTNNVIDSSTTFKIILSGITVKNNVALLCAYAHITKNKLNVLNRSKMKNTIYQACREFSNQDQLIIDSKNRKINLLNHFIEYKSELEAEDIFFNYYNSSKRLIYCVDFYFDRGLISSVQGEFKYDCKVFSLVDTFYTPFSLINKSFDALGFYKHAGKHCNNRGAMNGSTKKE